MMRPFAALGALLLVAPALVHSASTPIIERKCGVSKSLEAIAQAEALFLKNKVSATSFLASALGGDDDDNNHGDQLKKESNLRKALNGTIEVFFHVIARNKTIEQGWVPDSQIADQIKVMNDDYKATGLTFVLKNTTRTINGTWFSQAGPSTPYEKEMKKKLRVGGAGTLNVYTVGFESGDAAGLLGYATFPSDYESAPEEDGVVILFSTLPKGNTTNYNLGRTLTHEAGHWVGLYHTFEGGCGSVGDGVSDTAPEEKPASGCPVGRDTCPGDDLVDPIHNFMDYSYDSCLDNFSAGQIKRLQDQIATYRNITF